jgi:ABC-type sugar transport system permease subunit
MRATWWRLQYRFAPYLFLLPFLVVFGVFLLYPLGRSLLLSLHKTAGPRREIFVGLDNYRFLMGDRLFWGAVANTAAFTLVHLLIQIPAALGLAMLLNSPRVRLRSGFRFAFFSTYLVGPVFAAVLFSMVLGSRYGLFNQLLLRVLPHARPVNWLSDPNLAMPAVLVASLWLSIGFGMIYFLAALQAVDGQLYDAAAVDGAGRWSRFWHVTLPGIGPVVGFMVVVDLIGGFQLFELPYVLFQGAGPNSRAMTIVMYLFLAGFGAGDLGYASAIGWALVLIVLGVTVLPLWLMHRRGEAKRWKPTVSRASRPCSGENTGETPVIRSTRRGRK